MYPMEVLNRIKWTGNRTLYGVEIIYVNRGSKDDEALLKGSDIAEISKTWMTTVPNEDGIKTTLPEHRIKRILINGKLVWTKEDPKTLYK